MDEGTKPLYRKERSDKGSCFKCARPTVATQAAITITIEPVSWNSRQTMLPVSVFPEANGLYEAIIAAPCDMGLRLVFADWLEQQGDTQAELIRLQLQLVRAVHPFSARLDEQLADLQRRHRRQWNGRIHRFLNQTPLHGKAGSRRSLIRRWHFARGCVEALEVEPEAVREHAEILFRLGPLRQLRVRRPEWGLNRMLNERREHLLRLESLVLPTEEYVPLVRDAHLTGVRILVGIQTPWPVIR